MSETIWKFSLRPWSIFIDMPRGARLLSAGAQDIDIVVWAACDPEAEKVSRQVAAHPTGTKLPPAFQAAKFLDTVQMDDGLVFHVFFDGLEGE